jgi:hypothetical protein
VQHSLGTVKKLSSLYCALESYAVTCKKTIKEVHQEKKSIRRFPTDFSSKKLQQTNRQNIHIVENGRLISQTIII